MQIDKTSQGIFAAYLMKFTHAGLEKVQSHHRQSMQTLQLGRQIGEENKGGVGLEDDHLLDQIDIVL